MQSMSNIPPSGDMITPEVAKQELDEILLELENPSEETIELSMETLKGRVDTFNRLGYLGAIIWFADKQNRELQTAILDILETRMNIQEGTGALDVFGQEALYLDFQEEEDIERLYDLFDTIRAHSKGEVRMSSIYNIKTMNANMSAIVNGMKSYLNQALSK